MLTSYVAIFWPVEVGRIVVVGDSSFKVEGRGG
jgi:hypothetical protein